MQVTERFLTAWAAAEPAGGTGAPETRLVIGCTATGSLGFTLPKQAWLARHRSRDRTYQDCSSEEVRGPAISQGTGAVTAHQHPRQQPGPPDPEPMVLASNAGGRPLAAIHMSFIVGTHERPSHLRPRRQPAARTRPRGMSALDGQTALATGSVILAAGRPATLAVPFPPCPQLRRRPPQSP